MSAFKYIGHFLSETLVQAGLAVIASATDNRQYHKGINRESKP